MSVTDVGCSAVAILERDTADDDLLAWSFPGLESSIRGCIEAEFADEKASDRDGNFVSRYGDSWVYRYGCGKRILLHAEPSPMLLLT